MRRWMLLGAVASLAVTASAGTAQQTKKAEARRAEARSDPTSVAAADIATPPQTTAAKPVVVQPLTGPVVGGRTPLSYRFDRDENADAAQTAPVVTLGQAVALAYRRNPQLLAQRATVRSTDFRYPAARAQFGPQLTVDGSYTYTRTRTELIPGIFVGADGFASTASAVLNQPVFTFGRNSAAASGALAQTVFARDSLRVLEAQVMLNTIAAYVQVIRDASAVTIARQNLELLERQFNDNRERFQVREITSTDLQQVETRVEFGRAQLTNALGQLGISQSQFTQVTGALPGELTPPDLLNLSIGSVGQAYAIADVNSPVIRAAQSREKISRAAVEAAKAESRPRLDLQGSAGYNTVSPYTDQLRATQVVGRAVLTQPIIDSGLRNARRKEAMEANQADWRLLDQAVRDTHQAIAESWNQLTASRASIENYRLATQAAQRAYDGAQLQQKAGDRTTLDVLDLARDLLNIRLSYNAVIADEYIARASLLAAMGQLEAPLIAPGIAPDGTPGHFDKVKRQGDIPLLTPLLAGLDGVANRNTVRDRPIRDAGATELVDGLIPLQAPAAEGPTPPADQPR